MPGRPPRIVVTGVGAVSSFGWGARPFWEGLCSGTPGIGELTDLEGPLFSTDRAAQVPPAPPEVSRSSRSWRRLSRAERFGLASTAEAIAQSGFSTEIAGEASIFYSSSTGGMVETEDFYCEYAGLLSGRPRLRQVRSQVLSCPAETLARYLGVTRQVQTVSSACASGALAVGLALDSLRRGDSRVALAGGADSLCRTTYGGFGALESLAAASSQPFCLERDGLSLGEGGATLVLETLETALARGVEPIAELSGFGASADAYHMTAPHPQGEGAVVALDEALDDASLDLVDVGFVCAHGTGTDLNDRAEAAALRRVFGDRLPYVPVTAPKAAVGHLLGSAGAIEAVATVLMLRHEAIHPTAVSGTPDPDLGIDLVVGAPRPTRKPAVGVSLNLAFGGCNGALVFREWVG